MAVQEIVNQEPEETPVRQWHYDWPCEPAVEALSAAQTAKDWFEVASQNSDVLGHLGFGLAHLIKGDQYPSPDQLKPYAEHPVLAEKALRLCNLIFHSQAGTDILELSRASVLLGVKTVRNLLMMTALIDRVLVEPTPKFILPEIARMVLAGTYAVLMARKINPKMLNAEEILIATSMAYMGRLLAVYFGAERSQKLSALVGAGQKPIEAKIFEAAFGFQDQELSLLCAQHWFLGETLVKTLKQQESASQSFDIVQCAQKFTQGLFIGHRSDTFYDAKRQLASLCRLDADGVQDLMLEGLERAIEHLSYFDNPDLLEFVPYPKEEDEASHKAFEESIEHKGEPQSQVVTQAIQRLVQLSLTPTPNQEDVLNLVSQTLVKGCDLDRIVIFWLDPEKKGATSRILHQVEADELFERFELKNPHGYFQALEVDLHKPEGYLFRHILREKKVAWVSRASALVIRKLRNNAFNKIMGYGQFFIAPVVVHQQKVGLYYADRQLSHRKLDIQSYDLFTDICLQANKTLEAY